MNDEPLGSGLLDTLNNGLKQIIEQLNAILDKLNEISTKLDLANEVAATHLDLLTTQETDEGTLPTIPEFKLPPSMKKPRK